MRRECAAGQLRKNPPSRSSSPRREFLDTLQHVFVDIQRRAHTAIIHASIIRCQRVVRASPRYPLTIL